MPKSKLRKNHKQRVQARYINIQNIKAKILKDRKKQHEEFLNKLKEQMKLSVEEKPYIPNYEPIF